VKVRISWESRKAALEYPLGAPPRTAVLGNWFRASANVRIFRRGWTCAAQEFAPEAIAADWPKLRELAESHAVELTHAAIVIARPGEALLSPAGRELLWRGFHVPVFSQIVGPRGHLLAAECEAHDGLHLLVPQDIAVPDCSIDHSPCACGKKMPRLVPARVQDRARAAAAYAR
jgi:hypothetical protein